VSGAPAAAARGAGFTAGLFSDLAWTLAGQATAAAGVLVGFRLLTETLPPAVFGTVSLLTALATFARALGGFPVLQAALRHHPESAGAGRPHLFAAALRPELTRAALVTVGIALAAGLLGRLFFHASWPPFLLLAVFLAADLVRNLFHDLLNAGRRHAAYAAWAAAESWLRPLLGVLGALTFGATPAAVMTGYAVAAVVLATPMALSSQLRADLREPGPPADGEDDLLRRSMRRFALPLIPLALFGWATSVGDRFLVAGAQGAAAVGLYTAAYGLVNAPFATAQIALELALRPAYFQAVSAGDRAHERRLLGAWVGLSLAVGAFGVAAFLLLRAPLASIALGRAYRGAASLMPAIAVGLALWLVAAALERVCYAHKRTGGVLAAEGAGAVAFLLAAPPLILRRGAAGAALAVPVYFGVQLVAALLAARTAVKGAR